MLLARFRPAGALLSSLPLCSDSFFGGMWPCMWPPTFAASEILMPCLTRPECMQPVGLSALLWNSSASWMTQGLFSNLSLPSLTFS
ncbi:hypothetical protein EDB87DRAFT_1628298 [Lactarius vividus]|nr:hypothetical protein EDB87DRAFT_1628298 [Lactarius vividus]